MQDLKGLRAQEQGRNLPRAHEAAEGHRGAAAIVSGVDLDGEAFLAGLCPGDEILEVDGEPIADVLEFTFRTSGEASVLTVRRGDAVFPVELPGDGPTGLSFEKELFDGVRRCENDCEFCFVHQLPRPGLRRSLMVKDEDYRLSFLHGGYVTLGNFKEADWDRVFTMRLSPLYVSVHVTDDAVRRRMLGNPEAPPVMDQLRRLGDGGIEVHAQIVLVPERNDGELLSRSLTDLGGLDHVRSVAVVPVGLTDHRKNLPVLRSLRTEEAADAVARIEAARRIDRVGGRRRARFFAADELFQLAGLPLPAAAYYGSGFPLREDGVGMLRSFEDRFLKALPRAPAPAVPARVAIVTGTAAAPLFRRVVMPGLAGIPGLAAELVVVENRFFGKGITVAGLLTGVDIEAAVRARMQETGRGFDRVLVGEHAFQPGGEIMLDGPTAAELSARIGARVVRVEDEPAALLAAAAGRPRRRTRARASASYVTKVLDDMGEGDPTACAGPAPGACAGG